MEWKEAWSGRAADGAVALCREARNISTWYLVQCRYIVSI